MKYLDFETAGKLLQLNPYGKIAPEITDRQAEVIRKGFNFLLQPESKYLYIADEVGLGKTYIALGIASLLRYYSPYPERYRDFIVVPKRNLQYKWQKEIRQFIRHNFQVSHNRVKSITGKPVAHCGEAQIHQRLELAFTPGPSYELFRMSSFSLAGQEEGQWRDKLEQLLPPELRPRFREGRRVFGREDLLRRYYAYLLNLALPEIDLLIVDEAHNFKHGLGPDVAQRNQVVSRMLGVVQDDEEIFSHFPSLKHEIQPKVKKLILLSATPIDRNLGELKNQLDCFLPYHEFQQPLAEEELVNALTQGLSNFLIRGVMSIQIGTRNGISRNMYRQEHRYGNVSKEIPEQPQRLSGDFESMIMGLIQYRTIKLLKNNYGNRFEAGLLSGFESFAQSYTANEYEEVATRTQRTSPDQGIIRDIVESYQDQFGEFLPHPKQDNMVRVLEKYLAQGEKALVFVRRIATVEELEQKLLRAYENKMEQLIRKSASDKLPPVTELLRQLLEQREEREIKRTLDLLAYRIQYQRKALPEGFLKADDSGENNSLVSSLRTWLNDLYDWETDRPKLKQFRDLTKRHFGNKYLSKEYQELAIRLLHIFESEKSSEEDEGDEERADEPSPYFFDRFFAKKKGYGNNFRRKSYTKSWYLFNFLLLRQAFPALRHFGFDNELLSETAGKGLEKEIKRFETRQELIKQAFLRGGASDFSGVHPDFLESTFLTDLVSGPCKQEFSEWLDQQLGGGEATAHSLWEPLSVLGQLLRSVFRNGSGLLPAYLADSKDSDQFSEELQQLIEGPFQHVLQEVKTIIRDFDDLLRVNFPDTRNLERSLQHQSPVIGLSGAERRDVSRTALQFRMPGYPYILVATDIVKEGEDLHTYCKDVFHYGIAWNPSDMEQRTGRIDRIGSFCYKELKRSGDLGYKQNLHIFYPYLADTLEVNQVAKVFSDMNRFVETFYDFTRKEQAGHLVDIDPLIRHIPSPITEPLVSRYDHDQFWKNAPEGQKELLSLQPTVGLREKEASQRLGDLAGQLRSKYRFFIEPQERVKALEVVGSFRLANDRRAPFRIALENGDVPGAFVWALQSSIGEKRDQYKGLGESQMSERLRIAGIRLEEQDNHWVAKVEVPFDDSGVVERIYTLSGLCDELEAQLHLGEEDGDGFVF